MEKNVDREALVTVKKILVRSEGPGFFNKYFTTAIEIAIGLRLSSSFIVGA